MTRLRPITIVLAFVVLTAPRLTYGQADTLLVEHGGLIETVEIVKDPWGISHIYAQNEADLFFAQGYNAARDRLFQLEIWRRRATGTVAEILGPDEIRRDHGARLFKFRKNLTEELRHYHPRGVEIIAAFVEGINAYIAETRESPELLPIEFELLGIEPQDWTPEVVISRHQGLLGNIGAELNYGRAVALVGPEKVKEIEDFHPGDPDVALDPAIDGSLLSHDILGLYNAFRQSIRFEPEDLAATFRGDPGSSGDRPWGDAAPHRWLTERTVPNGLLGSEANAIERSGDLGTSSRTFGRDDVGSNNWVVMGEHTLSGYPIMANDPHRVQAAPPLRYWVHLDAPGWHVIGGGEPVLPGVSIGHNDHGAWGLTVFSRDGEDLYVYETNPDDPSQYRYDGEWADMEVIEEEIPVEGQDPARVELKYTPHGPVVYEDEANHVAYAVRAAWMEIGGAPYLASLRMNQAESWEEFREACYYHHIPGENMVWADRDGHIGWQASGISPRRPNWSGLVPVPGDGRYEWDGFLPIEELPNMHDPEKGFWATANANLIPLGYEHDDALSFTWADPYRTARINEVLGSGRRHSMMDMIALQTDYLSLPARQLVPLLRDLEADDPQVEQARQMLLDWDYVLNKNSVKAGIFVAWERRLQDNMEELFVPDEVEHLLGLSMHTMIDWIVTPRPEFTAYSASGTVAASENAVAPGAQVDPVSGRRAFLLHSLDEAVADLRERLGPDVNDWQYGQEAYKHAVIRHPLSSAVDEETRARLDVGPRPRGGNSYTVNNTAGGNNQTSGASFRIIVDTEDWDRTVGMNAPGQTGDPDSPYYDNLFELWANDRFFPVYYSRETVDSVAEVVIRLSGGSRTGN